jgi:four helix bundle protein
LVIGSSGHLVIDWLIGTLCELVDVMSAQSEQLKERTISFAITVLRLIDKCPHTTCGNVIGHQLAKSATSIGANYRAACSARSKSEFVAKLQIVVEEAEESVYWLDVIDRSQLLPLDVRAARAEANESRAIFASSLRTARANLRVRPSLNLPIPKSMTR